MSWGAAAFTINSQWHPFASRIQKNKEYLSAFGKFFSKLYGNIVLKEISVLIKLFDDIRKVGNDRGDFQE